MEETDRPAAFSRSQISPLPSLHMDMRWPPVTQRGSKGYVACYRLHGTASSASAVAVRIALSPSTGWMRSSHGSSAYGERAPRVSESKCYS